MGAFNTGLPSAAAGGSIKSVQRGVIALSGSSASATAAIAAVNTSKAELRLLGSTYSGTAGGEMMVSVALTNSTTVTANRVVGAAFNANVSWELTERT